jgi:hypothetical protein
MEQYDEDVDIFLNDISSYAFELFTAITQKGNGARIVPNNMIDSDPIELIKQMDMPSSKILNSLKSDPIFNIQDRLIECNKIKTRVDCDSLTATLAMDTLRYIMFFIDDQQFLKPLETPFDRYTPKAPLYQEEIDELNDYRIIVLERIEEIKKIYNSIKDKLKAEIEIAEAKEIAEEKVEEIKKEIVQIVQDNLVNTVRNKPLGKPKTQRWYNCFSNKTNKVAVDNDDLAQAYMVPGGKGKPKKHHKKQKTRRVQKQRKTRK